jgi:hypothetical protein
MTDHQAHRADTDERTFTWHPDYRGRTCESVERELADKIAIDQRAYELALSGAEKSEHQALASVMELEKRWSVYSFDWPETPSDGLARRIVEFELERDRRQEMIDYEQYRDESEARPQAASGGWRESMTDPERRRVANIGAAAVMVAIVLVLIIVVSIIL